MDSSSPRSAQEFRSMCGRGRERVLNSRLKQILTFLTPGYMILGVDIGCLAGLIEVDDAKAQK